MLHRIRSRGWLSAWASICKLHPENPNLQGHRQAMTDGIDRSPRRMKSDLNRCCIRLRTCRQWQAWQMQLS